MHFVGSFFVFIIENARSKKQNGTECSETSAHKIQTPGNHPQERIQDIVCAQNVFTCFFCDFRRAIIMSLNSTEQLLFVPDKHFTICEG